MRRLTRPCSCCREERSLVGWSVPMQWAPRVDQPPEGHEAGEPLGGMSAGMGSGLADITW
jgi:hypothetical protein